MIAPALREQVLALDEFDKMELANLLLGEPSDDEDETVNEAMTRKAEWDTGTIKPLTSEEFWRGLREE